ncbi:MAG: cytochrome c oxidase subunit 3 [Planctomycetes bacterium]|nr:cytochrome c oxidase subunit 3 [Planctomycetota bacterium]
MNGPSTGLLEPSPPLAPRGGGGGPPSGGSGRGDGGRESGGAGRRELPLTNARLLLMLALMASTMLFAGLIGAFLVLRKATPIWPPEGSPPLPEWLGWNCALAVASSAALLVAHVAQRRGRGGAMKAGLVVGTLLAGAFLALQWFGWQELRAAGFLPRSSNYGGNFWLLTSLHFAHAAAGLLLLLRASVLALRGYLIDRMGPSVEIAAVSWHFIDVAWIVIYFALHA